jgi:hypothetical protein
LDVAGRGRDFFERDDDGRLVSILVGPRDGDRLRYEGNDSGLSVAAVAVTGLRGLPGVLVPILLQRAADVIRLLESSRRVSPHEALVAVGRDELALATSAFCRHWCSE